MNVLWVCGVMRLEKDSSPGDEEGSTENDANEQEFDAWPSEEAKQKIEHAKHLATKYTNIVGNGGQLPSKWWEYDSDESSEFSEPEAQVN